MAVWEREASALYALSAVRGRASPLRTINDSGSMLDRDIEITLRSCTQQRGKTGARSTVILTNILRSKLNAR